MPIGIIKDHRKRSQKITQKIVSKQFLGIFSYGLLLCLLAPIKILSYLQVCGMNFSTPFYAGFLLHNKSSYRRYSGSIKHVMSPIDLNKAMEAEILEWRERSSTDDRELAQRLALCHRLMGFAQWFQLPLGADWQAIPDGNWKPLGVISLKGLKLVLQ